MEYSQGNNILINYMKTTEICRYFNSFDTIIIVLAHSSNFVSCGIFVKPFLSLIIQFEFSENISVLQINSIWPKSSGFRCSCTESNKVIY